MELFEKAKKYICNSKIDMLINNSDAVLVAYSGGADSSVLLYFLAEYLKDKNIPLAAAHLNHMIRGAEADRDQNFCRECAEKLGIPFYTKNIDIPKIAAESGKSTEEAARDERYAFLRDIAQTLGKNTIIATAHNATDNLETVIFNLTRGSGTTGMGGINPIRDNRIIRPLLSLTSEEIRSFAKENNIEYVTDSTNTDTAYTRNFVRKNIIPMIKELNPAAEDAALRLGKTARLEADYISSEADKITEKGYMDRSEYESLHPALRIRTIQSLYKKTKGSSSGLLAANLEISAEFALSGRGRISLPDNIILFSDTDRIYMGECQKNAVPDDIVLEANGKAVPFGKNFAVALCDNGKEPIYDKNIYNLFIQQSTSFDTIYGGIFVRIRRSGDRILAGHMHKKLKKLMCDADIPLRYRDTLPVFCDNEGILWVPKTALRDGAKGNKMTMYVFTLKG